MKAIAFAINLMISIEIVKSGCIPSDECQNAVSASGVQASSQYVCNSDGSKSSMAYEGHDCTSTESYAVLTFDADDTNIASFYDDVTCDGSCTQYIKYKDYSITDTSDSTCSSKYQYFTYVVETGCNSVSDSVSTKWSCTDNSITYTTYTNGDCSGDGFGLTYNNGCDNTLGYPAYYDIEYCGSGVDRAYIMFAAIITGFIFIYYL